MERNLILKEFLNLRKSLNQGNKLANEVTQFRFEVELTSESEYRLLAVVFGQQDRNAIELARRDKSGQWERSGFTKFKRLESFCANFLNTNGPEILRVKLKHSAIVQMDRLRLSQSLENEFNDLLANYLP